jgi:dienelactone hydrolase
LRSIILGVLAVLLLVAVTAFGSWATTPLPPTTTALHALQSDATVAVTVENDLITFAPTGSEATTGFIFYPGGDVDYRAYAAPAKEIAAQGYLVLVPHVLFNHAVFSPNVAADVIAANPQISNWVVGGHSLGGAMAARFAIAQSEVVDGVVLWGAYPGGDVDWTQSTLSFAIVYGTRDGLVTPDELDTARAQLPSDTVFAGVEGGNHAQFGDYGPQEGDLSPTISAAEQQQTAATATVELLQQISASE